jgi:valyl-tRNA synthetase
VTWWRELSLPVRAVLLPNGAFRPVSWGTPGWESRDPAAAQAAYDQLANLSAAKARARIVEMLRQSGDLIGEPRPIVHPVKFYEKGDRPLEIITSRQWFIRTMEFRDQLLARGRELQWHPEYMRHRYENWVNGLAGDWCISRQRFFGVPFPVWYRVRPDGSRDYESPIVPDESRLPVDPASDVPEGYSSEQRDQPDGFSADPDIMDTWATSSLTPQIVGGWLENPGLFSRVYPMDMRPQAHDIIRTWLFTTVFRSQLEHGTLPWAHAAISGFVVDPDRKKMSKSKGNVVTPMALLEEHGSDGVRYWAANARPGADTTFDPGQMKVGRRLATKILNASRFALLQAEPRGAVTAPLDKGMLLNLASLVRFATQKLDDYDFASALNEIEKSFWTFCDDYIELVKSRRYGDFGEESAASANTALAAALDTYLRLFAPYLPFVTEEVWSWWRPGSVHRAGWPTAGELERAAGPGADIRHYTEAQLATGEIRREKSLQGLKVKSPVKVIVEAQPDKIEILRLVDREISSANTATVVYQAGQNVQFTVTPTDGSSDLRP